MRWRKVALAAITSWKGLLLDRAAVGYLALAQRRGIPNGGGRLIQPPGPIVARDDHDGSRQGAWCDNVFVEGGSGRSCQIRRGVSAGRRQPRRGARPIRRYQDFYHRKRPHFRSLDARTPIAPISNTCRRSGQHKFRRPFRDITLVGPRPPGVPPRKTAVSHDGNRQRLHSIKGRNLSRRCRPALTVINRD